MEICYHCLALILSLFYVFELLSHYVDTFDQIAAGNVMYEFVKKIDF